VWSSIVANLALLLSLYENQPLHSNLKKFVANLAAPVLKDLGWTGDAANTGSFRSIVVSLLGKSGHKETIEEARNRFNDFIDNKNDAALGPDIRAAVYTLAVASGGEAEYEKLLKIYFENPLAEEQRRCLLAIGSAKSGELSVRTLSMILEGRIKAQDIATAAMAVVSASPDSKQLAWDWVKKHWPEIIKKFGDSLFVFSGFVGSVTSSFNTHEQATEIEEFFKANPTPQAERTIKQSVEKIRAAAEWVKRDGKVTEEWLQKN